MPKDQGYIKCTIFGREKMTDQRKPELLIPLHGGKLREALLRLPL